MADFFAGLTHGMLSLVGAGDLYDPLGDLNSSLAAANSALQQAKDTGAYKVLEWNETVQEGMIKFMEGQGKVIDKQMEYFNKVTLDKLQDVNVFMVLLSLMVIIIVFFLLIK